MSAPSATPTYLGPEDRPIFAWLHRPAGAGGELGLVICNPFGYEAVCAHRSLRHFAEAAAAAGVPAIRFDYDGTGDSAGDDRDPDRAGAWMGSIRTAIDALKSTTGVRRVALLGVRLGALLAAGAAAGRDDVAALIAVAPVVSGRLYTRELKALQGTLGLAPAPAGTPEDDVQEAVGFVLTEVTRKALAAIDLVKAAQAPAPEVLILDRDDLPASEPWRAALEAKGVKVEARQLPGYVEMVMDPQHAVPPRAMIDAATDWLKARQRPAAAAGADARAAVARPAPGIRERALFIDDGQLRFGIVVEPLEGVNGRAILMLNAGAVHHVGPNRLYTSLARRWAAQGFTVLRLDGAGLGDSRPLPHEPENVVYSPHHAADVEAGVSHLRRAGAATNVQVMGLCSGAYHGFKAAVAGQRIDQVVMINPLTFFYHPGDSLAAPRHKVAEAADRYSRSIFSVDKWRKLLHGDVDVAQAARLMRQQAAARLLDRLRDLSRRAGFPWKDDLGAELQTVARRGIAMQFVFAQGDPGVHLLTQQGGAAVAPLVRSGQIVVTTIDGPDHTFTPVWSHPLLADALDAALEVRRAP